MNIDKLLDQLKINKEELDSVGYTESTGFITLLITTREGFEYQLDIDYEDIPQ